jgi:hypothetical protein
MAPRPPGRPKAADIPELTVLQAVLSCSFSPLSKFPAKVVREKLRKLTEQGLLKTSTSGRFSLTPRGHSHLLELTDVR